MHNRRIKNGFMASVAITVLTAGSMACILVTSAASLSYADSISRREYRIQRRMNDRACLDTRDLILAKDIFFEESQSVPEFSCVIER